MSPTKPSLLNCSSQRAGLNYITLWNRRIGHKLAQCEIKSGQRGWGTGSGSRTRCQSLFTDSVNQSDTALFPSKSHMHHLPPPSHKKCGVTVKYMYLSSCSGMITCMIKEQPADSSAVRSSTGPKSWKRYLHQQTDSLLLFLLLLFISCCHHPQCEHQRLNRSLTLMLTVLMREPVWLHNHVGGTTRFQAFTLLH